MRLANLAVYSCTWVGWHPVHRYTCTHNHNLDTVSFKGCSVFTVCKQTNGKGLENLAVRIASSINVYFSRQRGKGSPTERPSLLFVYTFFILNSTFQLHGTLALEAVREEACRLFRSLPLCLQGSAIPYGSDSSDLPFP